MTASPVVITATGIVCPLGLGTAAVRESLRTGRGGIRPIRSIDARGLPIRSAGEIADFDPAQFVKPRKALKVMARDAQLAMAAAALACDEARLTDGAVDPDRLGVLFGAEIIRNPIEEVAQPFRACIKEGVYDFKHWGDDGLRACFPLAMLKLLPNMLGCHISIAHDARGPNNTLCLAEVSGVSAVGEATRVIQRGWADVMLAGAACSRINCYDLLRLWIGGEASPANDPERACRPFDADRDGQVRGEGAAVLVLESRPHAERRGAKALATVRGWGSSCVGRADGPRSGAAIRNAIRAALADARMTAREVGFVAAHGTATQAGDRAEAEALRDALPGVPVFAAKGYFGSSGAACGAVETAVAVLSLYDRRVPPTRNCDRLDPACPIDVIRGRPLTTFAPTCVVVSYTGCGQATALVLEG